MHYARVVGSRSGKGTLEGLLELVDFYIANQKTADDALALLEIWADGEIGPEEVAGKIDALGKEGC